MSHGKKMNQSKNDQPEDENNNLDDILKALNSLDEDQENPGDKSSPVSRDNLKDLIGDLLPIDENNVNQADVIENLADVSDLLSDEGITFNDRMDDQAQDDFPQSDAMLNVDGMDDFDERLKSIAAEGNLISNQTNEESSDLFSRKINPSDHSQELNDRLSPNQNKNHKPSDSPAYKEINELLSEESENDQFEEKSADGDLEELKQYIQFEEKTDEPKKLSFYKRLNSTEARKDPLVITLFLSLIAILLILISFIASQIVASPAWNPTLAPTPTALLDNTEPYIIGINYLGQQVPIKPIGGSFSTWIPETDEALVIEGSYFCRLVYIKNSVDVFTPEHLKLGNIITFNMTGSNNRVFQIINVTNSSFESFLKYANTQKECVAIYLESSQLVILAESTK